MLDVAKAHSVVQMEHVQWNVLSTLHVITMENVILVKTVPVQIAKESKIAVRMGWYVLETRVEQDSVVTEYKKEEKTVSLVQ